jgi:flagellar biosynthetic protein FliR
LLCIDALVETFELIPVGESLRAGARWDQLASLGSGLFSLGLRIALPVLATMLICNMALAVMARATPQLNLFSVGFPVTIVTGLLLIVLFLPFLATPFEAGLREALRLWR